MKARRKFLFRAGVGVLLGVVLGAVAYLCLPLVLEWWGEEPRSDTEKSAPTPPSHALVRDAKGRPVKPYTVRLSEDVIKALKIATEPVRPAGNLRLPPQIGTIGYDTDRLYPVRPRFQGEVIQFGTVPEYQRPPGSAAGQWTQRPLGPGDWVEKGKELAIIWSKEVGDRKVALVSALLDLYLDQEILKNLEAASGSIPPATLQNARTKVEKDLTTVYAAESSLGIARLTADEIEEIRKEAKVIQGRLRGKTETAAQRKQRITEDVKKWARVKVVAPRSGVLVEKNTNVDDIVDPARDTPLFRIADLSSLFINVNFNEEYLPLLQPVINQPGAGELRWKVRVEAEPDVPVLDLPILRVSPSLDPNAHTALVIGRVTNPIKDKHQRDKRLLVGQFVTATVEVPAGPGLVSIPTNALNEVNGESLVFVQPDRDKPEFVLKRVAVVRRSRELTQIRSKLTPAEEQISEEEVKQGRRPVETLRVGDRLLIRGVTELTDAFEALVAKARAEKK
jgi:cobalt-zinc-cadmium efflux system membrane fusion protein